MFEVPNAKRIKRARLFRDDEEDDSIESSRPSPPPGPNVGVEDEGQAPVADYGFEYDFIPPDQPATTSTQSRPSKKNTLDDHENDEEQPEYQFRLFSGLSNTRQSSTSKSIVEVKVRLSATPEPEALTEALSLEKARFVQPSRPQSYYFTSAYSVEDIRSLQAQYEQAAVSTEDILARQGMKWPGAALPWRCIHAKLVNIPSRKPGVPKPSTKTATSEEKRTRPSKKRRVVLRRRQALRKEIAAQNKIAAETEQEKRTRRNREKKVKRKEREKRKKTEIGVEATMRGVMSDEEADETDPVVGTGQKAATAADVQSRAEKKGISSEGSIGSPGAARNRRAPTSPALT